MSDNQEITTLELAVRMVMYGVGATNTIPIKLSSAGKVYGDLHIGTGLSLASRSGLTYLDAAESSSVGAVGIPLYLNHEAVPEPDPELSIVSPYFIFDDYEFMYLLWPDGSRHERRIALDHEDGV
jgi:hypothetical protein